MKKNEGSITVQLYKVALRTGHTEAICNCQGSLLSLIVCNKALERAPWSPVQRQPTLEHRRRHKMAIFPKGRSGTWWG